MTLRHASSLKVCPSPSLQIKIFSSRLTQVHLPLSSIYRRVHSRQYLKEQTTDTLSTCGISRTSINNPKWPKEINPYNKKEVSDEEIFNNQAYSSDLSKVQKIQDLRWRQLKFWLNLVTNYRFCHPRSIIQQPKRKNLVLRPRISNKDVRNLLQEITENGSMTQIHSFYTKKMMWLEFFAKVLYSHPTRALEVLEAFARILPKFLCIPQTAIADILHCIIVHYFQDAKSTESEDLMHVATRIIDLLYTIPSSLVLPLSDHCVFLLLSNLPRPYLEDFYVYLSKNNAKVSIWTIMQFSSRLAKAGLLDLAFEAIQRLTGTNCHLNRPNSLSVFTSVLHHSHHDPKIPSDTLKIFKYLISSGVKPNIFLYNVVLHSLIEGQEAQSAWAFYERMIQESIEPDVTTYSILLNDAKRRADTPTITRIIQIVRQHGKTSGYIITDIIHAIFLLHQKPLSQSKSNVEHMNSQAVFDQMLQLYVEYFKLDKLFKLIPGLSHAYKLSSNLDSSRPLWDPPAPTLCVMITGFLAIVDSIGAKNFYENFKNLVLTGHPAVASLVRTTYIYNVILMCFYKFEDRAKDAPDVIANMLSYDKENNIKDKSSETTSIASADHKTPKNNSNVNFSGVVPHSPAKPDVYTWSILVKIFMRLRLTRSAEKVLGMMVRRNIQPEMVTWTSLIAGYARMQDPIMTANAVNRFEEAGFESDDYILRVLSKVWQQKTLINEMEFPRSQKIKPVSPEWIDDLKDNLAVDIAENSIDDQLYLSS
ncbi:hypothetical protein HI914_03576 [Erysiphe necator]|uniref:Putative pentatricopeptide repeat protein n=1 Tax=Uncinula necator TaxID=52586 RepID=A0A0B1P681_UNCNE|nr:hypothetical protein HI914_03576 [Erysiphe necator]KHJ32451.1 putative pentatricopeptide repeat protein [Erysiphe necator]